jgi:hypothetical protein
MWEAQEAEIGQFWKDQSNDQKYRNNAFRMLPLDITVINVGNDKWNAGHLWIDSSRFVGMPGFWTPLKFWSVNLFSLESESLESETRDYFFPGASVFHSDLIPAVSGFTPDPDKPKQYLNFLNRAHATNSVPYVAGNMLNLSSVPDGEYRFEFTLNPSKFDGANSVVVSRGLRLDKISATFFDLP